MKYCLFLAIAFLFTFNKTLVAQPSDSLSLRKVKIKGNIELHYVEIGKGEPVIFVHGSLSDFSYWQGELDLFSKYYTVISYSRRYNVPNHNTIVPGYSAIKDAEDLAGLIKELKLGKVYIVGHSYGALTALFLARDHPELIKSLVLCEPPAVSLLNHLEGDKADYGKGLYNDIQEHMVKPMKEAFKKGNRERGVKIFMNYVLQDSLAWQKLSYDEKQETLAGTEEWNAILKQGELFPEITPAQIKNIKAPTLILTGTKTYNFLRAIDEELSKLLPNNKQVIIEGASHRMWFEKSGECKRAVLYFLSHHEGLLTLAN